MGTVPPLFPPLTRPYLSAFQFSAWYPDIANSGLTIKSTIIRPLSADFVDYLNADGVFVPDGSEDWVAESTLSDDEENGDSGEDEPAVRHYAFPHLDAQIRACVQEYGAVFPKLNFSSPKDASWILPPSSPLKCVAPADVYLLLKSSDFITHDLDPEIVFEGTGPEAEQEAESPYQLELILRKWYSVDRSREIRCFVRENILLGISQRDPNFYPYMTDPSTQTTIRSTAQTFWEKNIKTRWEGIATYTFDLLLTRDLTRGHILDFNAFTSRTDPLLFSYEELAELFGQVKAERENSETGLSPPSLAISVEPISSLLASLPQLRVIDSGSHPTAACPSPANQHNMIPFDALTMSSGRDIEEFAEAWKEGLKESNLEAT